jgi:hypothetical protein
MKMGEADNRCECFGGDNSIFPLGNPTFTFTPTVVIFIKSSQLYLVYEN